MQGSQSHLSNFASQMRARSAHPAAKLNQLQNDERIQQELQDIESKH